jgi:hypothetical protein
VFSVDHGEHRGKTRFKINSSRLNALCGMLLISVASVVKDLIKGGD